MSRPAHKPEPAPADTKPEVLVTFGDDAELARQALEKVADILLEILLTKDFDALE